MKSNLLIAATALLLSFSTLAVSADEAKKDAKKDTKKGEITCAVQTANKVNIEAATKLGEGKGYADYKGNRYFFCCGGCPEAFAKDPAHFAKSAHIKTPKASKPAKKDDKPKVG